MPNFQPQQVKHLFKLLGRPPKGLRKGTPEDFLLRYVFLEALLRSIGRYYRERPNHQKKKTSGDDASLNIDVVERSLRHFGIDVSRERLALLLASSSKTRGSRSARVLRNGLVHCWDAGDAAEIIKRFGLLDGALCGVVASITARLKGVTR